MQGLRGHLAVPWFGWVERARKSAEIRQLVFKCILCFLFMVVRVTPLSAVSRHICHELLQACRPCWKQAPGRVVLLCAVQLMQLRFFFLRT